MLDFDHHGCQRSASHKKRSTPLTQGARRMQQRLGRKKACVAIARKLASILWAVWLMERDYDPRTVV